MAVKRIGVDAASGKGHIRNLPPTGQPDVLKVTFIKWKSRITLLLLVVAVMLLGGCSGGSGGDSTPGAEAPASGLTLDAVAEPGQVRLSWSETSPASALSRAAFASAAPRAAVAKIYNLYYATEPDCDVANYASCAGGMMVADVDSPYVVDGLDNDQNYWFYLEAVAEGGNAVSDEKGAHPNLWMPNGEVYAIANDADGNVYLGGTFTTVGPYTGHGAPLSPTTGKTDGAYPRVDGIVSAAASDGAGGYYIGGSFTTVGGESRSGLAHILANGTVDPDWHPDTNGGVSAIAVAADTVYVGGQFTQIDDGSGAQTRYRLAAIGTDGTLSDTWTLDTDNSGSVYTLAVLGSTVYVGGDFTTIGGTARSRLAAINTDGTLADWNPGANNAVFEFAVSSDTVYISGAFSSVGGAARSYLAAVTANGTGTVSGTWNPAPNAPPTALAVSGSTVYVGGNFSNIGAGLAAIATDGTLSNTWQPSLTGSLVSTLMVSGNTVYIGGNFTAIDGQTRSNLAAVTTDGTLSDWNPVANDQVNVVAASGDTIYAGGLFKEIGGEPRNNLAAYNADGILTDWNPDADNAVWALAVSGSTVYAGGRFTSVGGETRDYLAAIGTDGTLSTTWRPSADFDVYALTVSNGMVYAGGFFTNINDNIGSGLQTRLSLAALDATTGQLDPNWHPSANDEVDAIAVSGSTVYVGGWFTSIDDGSGSVARGQLAAIGTDGSLDTTTWIPDANDAVYALAVSGGTVYMGGDFTSINDGKGGGAQARSHLAAVDSSGNLSTDWTPATTSGGWDSVNALTVWNNMVYVGGTFASANDGKGSGDLQRYGIAAFGTDGYLSDWAPDADNTVYAINVTEFGTSVSVNVGGNFNSINGETALFYATLEP